MNKEARILLTKVEKVTFPGNRICFKSQESAIKWAIILFISRKVERVTFPSPSRTMKFEKTGNRNCLSYRLFWFIRIKYEGKGMPNCCGANFHDYFGPIWRSVFFTTFPWDFLPQIRFEIRKGAILFILLVKYKESLEFWTTNQMKSIG